jgi:hypothetical protein
LDKAVSTGDGPAYQCIDTMVNVEREESLESSYGAPRVLLAALLRLAMPSGIIRRIPRAKAKMGGASSG